MRRYNLLRVAGLQAGYVPGRPALIELDLDVDEHEVVCVLGSNGAGKSTLLKSIAGALTPWQGMVTFRGEDITGVPAHRLVERGVVLCPAGRQVFPEMSVHDNLLLGAHTFGRDGARVSRMTASVYDRFSFLGERRKMAAGSLSAGQQQILSIARSLMSRPDLLMLDEPSMGLDPSALRRVVDLILELRAQGTTLLMVEKLAHLATSLADRILVLELGRRVLFGPASEVAGDPRVEEAYIGRSSGLDSG